MRTPRECSQWRSAPATTASTTSLTVPPKAFLTALKSASSDATPAKRRCGPISTFSGDGGAGLAAAQMISPRPSAVIFASSIARSGRLSEPQRLGGDAERGLRHPGHAGREQVQRARLVVGHPRLEAVLERTSLRAEVEQHRAEVDAGDPVDHRVVALGEQREAAAGQALDEPQLPQRLGAVQLLGEHARGEVHELLVAAGRGQRGVADVVLEVEVAVVGPQRPAGRGGRVDEPLAVARHVVQARADRVQELVVGRRRALRAHERADVHVRVRSLLVQEGRVDCGEPVEVARRHGRSA